MMARTGGLGAGLERNHSRAMAWREAQAQARTDQPGPG